MLIQLLKPIVCELPGLVDQEREVCREAEMWVEGFAEMLWEQQEEVQTELRGLLGGGCLLWWRLLGQLVGLVGLTEGQWLECCGVDGAVLAAGCGGR